MARRSQGHGFERLPDAYGKYWLIRDRKTGILYVSWLDVEGRQTRRRSLSTRSPIEAAKIAEGLVVAGITGDPKDHLNKKQIETVGDVLDYYWTEHASKIRSSEAAKIAIENFLRPVFGNTPLRALKKRTLKDYATKLTEQGYELSYISRIFSVMRAAFNLALEDEEIAAAPPVPEVRDMAAIDSAALRGRRLEVSEIALLIDAISEKHMLNYVIALLNTAARPEAILEAEAEQIEWGHSLFELNPRGRRQTKKFRPIVRITKTWKTWLELIKSGPIVTYDGSAIKSTKTAMRNLVRKAKLTGRVNATSIRHTIGHYMENVVRIPGREISIFLGHVPVTKKRSTRRYSGVDPYADDYLSNAVVAVEAFVREVNKHTKKWDLEKPYTIKPGWKEPK